MKKLNLVISVLMVAAATRLAYAKKMMGDDISNMIIEGENRLRAHSQIPEREAQVDVYKDVPGLLRDNGLMADLKPPTISRPPVTLPMKSLSEKTASPWLNSIFEAPVLTLAMKPQKDVGKTQYIFLVKDSRGGIFYELKENGRLPEFVEWNGVGTSGKPLRVGDDYSYSMSIIDQAGNPQRFAGKPFRLDTFRFNRSGNTVTSIHPDALFAERSSLKFSADGKNTMMEMKDYLRSRYGRKISIMAYDDDQKFAISRSKVLQDFLIRSLNLPADRIEAQGFSKSEGDGYKHVDIIAE